jgi:hypothetical protein
VDGILHQNVEERRSFVPSRPGWFPPGCRSESRKNERWKNENRQSESHLICSSYLICWSFPSHLICSSHLIDSTRSSHLICSRTLPTCPFLHASRHSDAPRRRDDLAGGNQQASMEFRRAKCQHTAAPVSPVDLRGRHASGTRRRSPPIHDHQGHHDDTHDGEREAHAQRSRTESDDENQHGKGSDEAWLQRKAGL